MSDLYAGLKRAAEKSSAITIRADLVSASSVDGDPTQYVFPPTFVDVGHLTSPVREDGTHEYVLIDSTQSWANRLEEVADDPALGLPRIDVRVGEQVLSAYKLPHRVYDAILRDSTLGETSYRDTPLGRALTGARPADASALLRHAPTVLLFGGWDSFAGLKVGAAKWPAALAGQILGFDAQLSRKAGVRVDPLEISIDDFQSYKAATSGEVWTLEAGEAEKDGKNKPVTIKPSEVGHGNILATVVYKGAWVSRIELRTSLSITRLRRYHFPVEGVASADRDHAAVTLLVCLAVVLMAERLQRGLDLRAGAELDVRSAKWLLRGSMVDDEPLEVTPEAAREALERAKADAAAFGLTFGENVTLTAKPKLQKIVERAGS
jgi:CRISPR-associated protein Csb1